MVGGGMRRYINSKPTQITCWLSLLTRKVVFNTEGTLFYGFSLTPFFFVVVGVTWLAEPKDKGWLIIIRMMHF